MTSISLPNDISASTVATVEPVPTLVSGFLFSLSLIVAIGAQNAFVLRQGAVRSHIGTVVAICAVSDVLLIGAGVGGLGVIVSHDHGALIVLRVAGAAVLLAYALLAARRVLSEPVGPAALHGRADSRRGVVAACLGFTWLNPAVYLDIVLLGSVASAHPSSRWWFGAGAASASISWFIALGLGAGLLSPVLRRPQGARCLDLFVAGMMLAAALRTLPV
jgi:L-lysine exporter family protein LysE/ArgO